MHIVVIDTNPELRSTLLGRTREAIRQVGVKRIEPLELAVSDLETFQWSIAIGVIIGPGVDGALPDVIEQVKALCPAADICAVLPKQQYLAESVSLRKRFEISVVTEGDLAQLAGFILDCESQGDTGGSGFKNRGVVGVLHFKGGVGATSIAAACASCLSKNGLTTAILDFDDVNPEITQWARVGTAHREATGALLREGEVPQHRLNQLLYPIENGTKQLFAIGQPESYSQAFHFKSNVIDDAPPSSRFVNSLIESLKTEFDAIVIDLGRSWGLSTFAALPLCKTVLMVVDDDPKSFKRSLEVLRRIRSESDDPEEFDFSKWSLVLNAVTGYMVTPKMCKAEMKEVDLFSLNMDLHAIPYSAKGRSWGAPGQTLFELGESSVKTAIQTLSKSVIPFVGGNTRDTGKMTALKFRRRA